MNLKSLVLLLLCALIQSLLHTEAQQINTSPWPEDDSPDSVYVSVLVGWDMTGMTPEEIAAFMGILRPLNEQEVLQILTDEQRRQRNEDLGAFASPEAFENWRATHPLTPKESITRDAAAWAITHPVEYSQNQLQFLTPAQRDDMQAAAFALMNAVMKTLPQPSPEQLAAWQQAAKEMAHPVFKPKPITATITLSELWASRTNTLPSQP